MLRRFAREVHALGESLPLISFLVRLCTVFSVRWSLTPWLQREHPKAVQHSLLRVLAIADREQLDVKQLIESLAYEHWGAQRHRLLRLARCIPENTDWLAALEKYPGMIGNYALTALRVGARSNTMDATWQELLKNERPVDASSLRLTRNRWMYWPFLALLFIVVGSYAFYSPRGVFRQLNRSFPDVTLPWSFQTLAMALEFLTDHLGSLVVVGVIVVVLSAVPSLRMRIVQWLAMCVPWRRRAQESNQLLRHLSVLHSQERPLAESLSVLQNSHVDARSRNRLAAMHLEATANENGWQCLYKHGIMSQDEVNAVEQAANASVQSWILGHLATKRRESLYFRGLIGGMLTQPILTLVFGGMVLWISLALMGMLNELVYSLAEVER
jgi:type II secretory pathway component PulF